MLVPDYVIYLLLWGIGLFFFVASLFIPKSIEDTEGKFSDFGFGVSLIRLYIFPPISAVIWIIISGMSLQINNCDTAYGACFTNPANNTTTASIYNFNFSNTLNYLSLTFFYLSLVLEVVYIFLYWYFIFKKSAPAGR